MKKLLVLIMVLGLLNISAAPTRQFTYTSGNVIEPTEVTSNEDAIFTYLQAGVEVLANNSVTSAKITDGAIVNADINSSAAIAGSKISPTFDDAVIVNDDGSNSACVTIANTGTNHGLFINQTGVLAALGYALYAYSDAIQVNSPLIYARQNNTSSTADLMHISNAGDGSAIRADHSGDTDYGVEINGSTAMSAHMFLNPVSSVIGTTEGEIYADDDNKPYYHNGTAFKAFTLAADFAEEMEAKKSWDNYEVGDVIILASNLKVDKSSKPYEEGLMGVISDRGGTNFTRGNKIFGDNEIDEKRKEKILKKKEQDRSKYDKKFLSRCGKTFEEINKYQVQVGIIGLVKCKVNNENGAIKIGDLLTSSSTTGVAMKATPATFAEYSSCIGKARESFNGTEGVVEILVGVK